MKKLAASLALLLGLVALGAPPAHAQAVSQYTKVVSATSVNTAVSFGFSALQVTAANDGASTAYVSISGVAAATDTASVALNVCETGTWYFPASAPVSSIGIATANPNTATVRVNAFTVSNLNLPNVAPGGNQPFFKKEQHCGVASGNEAVGGNLTVGGTAAITGVATLTAAPVFSSTTASRLLVVDAGKGLTVNGSITTGAVPKSVSSGASLAASSVSDDGTNVTIAEPLLVSAGNVQGNFNTFALTSGAAAATFVKVAIPSNSAAHLLVEYVFEASTATPHVQSFGGLLTINAVNVGGAITCTVGVPTTATQAALATDGGTLTNAITCADATGGVMNILATDTSSITPTTNRIRYRIFGLAGTTLTMTAQ